MATDSQLSQEKVVVTAKDLPLHCPPKNAPLWSQHPRVFLDIEDSGRILCPYCSTLYVFEGPKPRQH